MNYNTTNEIIQLALSETEQQHTSRSRRSYHVFLSRFFFDFKRKTREEKELVLVSNNIWREEDDSSIDSILTPRTPQAHEIMQAASKYWRGLSPSIKEAWGARTAALNSREPNNGSFEKVPRSIITAGIETNVMKSLSLDWVCFVKHMKSSVMNNRAADVAASRNMYVFGKEKILLLNQFYKTFHLNYLLKVTMFGSPLFSSLYPFEIVHRSKKQTVIHFSSHRRIREIFTFGGMDASTYCKNGLRYICCGKVCLINQKGMETIGYIIDETESKLKTRVEGRDGDVEVDRPYYDNDAGSYNYNYGSDGDGGHTGQNCDSFSISEYWPVRFKINDSGQCSFILARSF
jgi:hypothetical protein